MAENPFTATATAAPLNRALVAQADPEVMRGVNWFWWIIALSIVNTISVHAGSDRNFVIGLGFTLLADVGLREYAIIALVIDAVALGTFATLGFLSRKGHLWAFITGAVLYSLDTLIYLFLQDWMSVGFHGLALFYMFKGVAQLRTALKAAAEAPPEAAAPPAAPAT